MTEFLRLDDLFSFVRALNVGPIRDVGLLDSALARPRSSIFGTDAYPSLELKAAALLHSITNNHPLVDGNKRLAWLSTVVFLDINGHEPNINDDDAFNLVWDIAGTRMELADIAHRLNVTRKGN